MDLRENLISGTSVAGTETQADLVPSDANEAIDECSRGDAEPMLDVVDADGLNTHFGPMADRSRPSRLTGRLDLEKKENGAGPGDMRIASQGALQSSAAIRASLRRTAVLALGGARKTVAIAPPTTSVDCRVPSGVNAFSVGRVAQGFPATNSEDCKSNGIGA